MIVFKKEGVKIEKEGEREVPGFSPLPSPIQEVIYFDRRLIDQTFHFIRMKSLSGAQDGRTMKTKRRRDGDKESPKFKRDIAEGLGSG